MIQSKLEIRYVIHCLNELEKLKLLLFDEDQYYLFEHIPKPYLIDGAVAKKVDNYEQGSTPRANLNSLDGRNQGGSPKTASRKTLMKSKKSKSEILMSNNTF